MWTPGNVVRVVFFSLYLLFAVFAGALASFNTLYHSGNLYVRARQPKLLLFDLGCLVLYMAIHCLREITQAFGRPLPCGLTTAAALFSSATFTVVFNIRGMNLMIAVSERRGDPAHVAWLGTLSQAGAVGPGVLSILAFLISETSHAPLCHQM